MQRVASLVGTFSGVMRLDLDGFSLDLPPCWSGLEDVTYSDPTTLPPVAFAADGGLGRLMVAELLFEDDEEPGSVLLDLYEHGFAGKVVLIAPDRGPRVRRIVEKLPLAGVLVKPLEDTALLRLLADIGAEGTGASLRNVA